VSHEHTKTVTRNLIVLALGTPDVTIGSVNEPREREEQGLRFNEKWIYRRGKRDPRRPHERHIYWHRYDFVAAMMMDESGNLSREDVTALVAGLDDRAFHHDLPRNV
jgi:hypothetical protein